MNIVIITGASSGIGREFAYQLDRGLESIDEFWLVARRMDRLEELNKSLKHKCRLLPLDLLEEEQIDRLAAFVAHHRAAVRILVNAAGIGYMGPFSSLTEDEIKGQLDLNVKSLTMLCYKLLPFMKEGSRIFNMASSAAFLPQPDFAVYSASKAYVLSFSRALNREVKNRKIYVIAVSPGPVNTEFFDIAEKSGKTLAIKKLSMVQASSVVSCALKDSYRGKDVSVCSTMMKSFTVLCKIVPHSLILSVMDVMKKVES